MRYIPLTATLAALTTGVLAQDRITLANGDVLTGAIKTMADGKVTINSPLLGDVVVPMSNISDMSTTETVNLQKASGDLLVNRRILGSVARIPGPGSRLANLHQGASVRAFDPTPRQLAAVAAVADALSPRGLHLLGLDFIGDLLSEINFTSPSALVQINEVMHKRAEQDLVDELVEMARMNEAVEIERRAGLGRAAPDVA